MPVRGTCHACQKTFRPSAEGEAVRLPLSDCKYTDYSRMRQKNQEKMLNQCTALHSVMFLASDEKATPTLTTGRPSEPYFSA